MRGGVYFALLTVRSQCSCWWAPNCPVEGIEYPVTNAYQPAGRIVHLWHHQLEGVPNAVDTSSGEQFGHLLELRGNLPAQLPVW
jgi:hypothetical protein|uniref:Uncharacterized protein n=2 Tax=Serratia marcescens TaxID=615 RepID=A0A4P3ALA4_SERMA|nr:TPA_exp: hypothetical protein [Serratia marcescens BIDMC 80]DAC77108.1 TPA_exp: hypothetical protein [Serratia marcescens]DAC77152.1 TPA_exp: hypothetical protein [Serratia marcescens]DAC77196.1 TPA_exp: hypothetical protein [Serratia marcescens]DAC77241.1 TPA_exp: hypothetical protein [Serratia marcescens]